MVITVDIYKEIRKRRLEGESQRGIARALGISRNTVKKYWEGERVPGKRIERPREPSVLTPEVRAFIDSCLKSDEDSPGKQRHTAKRIYDRLVAEQGFTGGETTVRSYVKKGPGENAGSVRASGFCTGGSDADRLGRGHELGVWGEAGAEPVLRPAVP